VRFYVCRSFAAPVNAQVVTDQQTSCNKVVVKPIFVVTRLMTVTDLLQVVPTRLIQAVRNKLVRTCCHELVNNLLCADDIRLVATFCCESVGLVNLVTR
jgi:hypothetical protein